MSERCKLSRRYFSVLTDGNKYIIRDIENTIKQSNENLLIILEYLHKCIDLIVNVSSPLTTIFDYISMCERIRIYTREIDSVVQGTQYNGKQLLSAKKSSYRTKNIVFNVYPLGDDFIFETPIIDTTALEIDDYKIGWGNKHVSFEGLVATHPCNLNKLDNVTLVDTYTFDRIPIGHGKIYTQYGIDRRNITSLTLILNKDYELHNYSTLELFDSENKSYNRIVLGDSKYYVSLIGNDTKSHVDFCSHDLNEMSFPLPDCSSVNSLDKLVRDKIGQHKMRFCKAIDLVSKEIDKMEHYNKISVPIRQKSNQIHNKGHAHLLKSKNHCSFYTSRLNVKNRKSRLNYKDNKRTIKKFGEGSIEIIHKNEKIIMDIDNEKDDVYTTYNDNNFIEIHLEDGTHYLKYEYDDKEYKNELFFDST